MALEQQAVLNALQIVQDPNTGKNYVSGKALKNLQIIGGDVSFDVALGYPAKSQIAGIRKMLIADDYGISYLGPLPLDMQIRLQADNGRSTVVADPDGEVGVYKEVTHQVAIMIATKAKDFPTSSRPSRYRKKPDLATAG